MKVVLGFKGRGGLTVLESFFRFAFASSRRCFFNLLCSFVASSDSESDEDEELLEELDLSASPPARLATVDAFFHLDRADGDG